MNEKIPLICATDENYAPFASIMMKSVLMHTKSFIDFYVLDGGIKDKTKKLIQEDLKKYSNHELHFVDMSKFNLSKFPSIHHYSVNAFSRYFIPLILHDYKKVLYMDVDIIVRRDITELYQQNMDNFPIAAVLEDFYEGNYTYLKQYIWPKYTAGDRYFNSGVLLMDIQKLNKMNFTEKAIQLTCQIYDRLNTADQDIFNILFENNFKILDYRFNYMPDHITFLKEKHPEITSINPVVLHYTARKPWKAKSCASEDFEKVLNQSVFMEKVVSKYKTYECLTYYLFGFIPFLKKYKI